MSKEVKNYIKKYMTGDNDWLYPSNSSVNYLEFIRLLGKCLPSDAPDLYFVNGNTILIAEHFRFDSSMAVKNKGSDEKRQEADNLRNSNKIIKNISSGEIVNGSFYSERKPEYYLSNLQHAFEEHYAKINQYKMNVCKALNLRFEEYSFIVAFIIEDISAFGNVCLFKKPMLILPMNVTEFLDFCSNKTDVNFLICSSETFGSNGTITYLLANSDIEKAKRNSISILGKELVNLEINTISGNIFIPFSK